MSWGAVAGAAISVGGSLLAGDKEVEGIDAAQRNFEQLKPLAESIRQNLTVEGKQSRKRLGAKGGDLQAYLDGIGEDIIQDTEGAQNLQNDVIAQLQRVIGGDFESTPGYEFMRDEALRGVERAASARGANVSGNVLAELTDRASGLAANEYTRIISNLQGLLSTTGGITGTAQGQRASLASNAAGIYSDLFRTGETISSDLFKAGEIQYGGMLTTALTGQAAGNVAKGQSKAGTISDIAGAAGSAAPKLIEGIGSLFGS